MPRSRRLLLWPFLALCFVPHRSEAARNWLEIKSPHFTIVSADTERISRTIIWEFEQIRAFCETLWPWARVNADKPLLIIAVPDEGLMKMLAPGYWEKGDFRPSTVFAESADRYVVALRSDLRAGNEDGLNPYYTAYWSYLTLIVDASLERRLPPWFQHGLVNVFSNTRVRENEIQIGRVVPNHFRQVNAAPRLSLLDLITLPWTSPWLTDPYRRGILDAQAALFMHMLLFSAQSPERAAKVGAYIDRTQKGESSLAAFEALFGPPARLEDEFAQYIKRPLLQYSRAQLDLRVQRDRLVARPLSAAEAAIAAASFHIATGRNVEARSELQAARKTETNLAAIDDLEGILLDDGKETEPAKAAFTRATERNSTSYYSYFRLANLLARQSPGPDILPTLEQLLDRSVALNQNFNPSHRMLSTIKVDLGRRAEGITMAQRAVALKPSDIGTRLSLARLLANEKRYIDAFAHAHAARELSAESGSPREADDLIAKIIAAAIADEPPPPAPAPNPPGAVHVGGSVKTPNKTKNVAPSYPPLAAAAKVQGVVVVELVIGPDGKVIDARVLRAQPLLNQAALDAVRLWEFEPPVVDGKPGTVIMSTALNFAAQ
jgi:TonB family protein